MLVRNVILNGSYQRFGKAYHINEWVKWVRNLLGPDELRSFNRYIVPLGTEIQVMAVLSLYEDSVWFQNHISNILWFQGK